tara:strand:- start:164 stop:364 length:201 start_codon:yes stop_codon:yes gene_type:complete
MKEIVKNILDEYSKSSPQINLDSDSARNELATYIAKEISKPKEYILPEEELGGEIYQDGHQVIVTL